MEREGVRRMGDEMASEGCGRGEKVGGGKG